MSGQAAATGPASNARDRGTIDPPLISSLDPFSADAIASSTAWDHLLREAGPVVWLEKYGVWAMGRHADVFVVMKDWETFCSSGQVFTNPHFSFPKVLLQADPPGHTITRSVMNRILSGPALRSLEDRLNREARDLVQKVASKGAFDAVTDLVQPYILAVLGDSVGITKEGRDRLIPYGLLIQNTLGPFDKTFQDSFEKALEVMPWVNQQCEKSALSLDGFGAQIYAAAERGELPESEAPVLVQTFLGAGIDTTVAAITNAIHALARHQDQWRLLRQDLSLARGAFEEALRFDPPVRFVPRVAAKDVEFSGVNLRRGDGLLLFFSAAARDPRKWADADIFDIRRKPSGQGHLTFGVGIHNCVGQMLARMEAMALLTALATHVSEIQIESEPQIQYSNQIRSFAHLPIAAVSAD